MKGVIIMSKLEKEVKVLHINVENVKSKLEKLGAKYVNKEE